MLSVKRILTLYYARVERIALFPGGFDKRIRHRKIRHCRKFNGRVLSACPFHTNGTRCNYYVATFHFCLHTAAGSDPNKGIRTAPVQLFHRNRGGRAAYSRRRNAYLYAVQRPCVSNILSIIRN